MTSLPKVQMSVVNGEIAGFCDPRFERVAEAFARNFQDRNEVGASVCIKMDGEPVVDLWGGMAHPATQTPWEKDTLSLVWSATKGATALCAHILASRGLLDLHAPVTRYWPEFGQAGKESIPVKMLLIANGGSLNGVKLVSRESLARIGAVSSASGLDAIILAPTRFSLGYVKSIDNRHEPSCTKDDSVILSEEAFGHSGFGGAIGFADPVEGMSFGYVMNRMGQGLGLNERGQSLIDAAYLSLGYSSNASGVWLKQ